MSPRTSTEGVGSGTELSYPLESNHDRHAKPTEHSDLFRCTTWSPVPDPRSSFRTQCFDQRVGSRTTCWKNTDPLGEFCPDLLLGAGRRVHVPMLKAKIQTKAKSVVLMRPTLWTFGYDLAVVPNHDRMKPHPNIIRTTWPQPPFNPVATTASVGLSHWLVDPLDTFLGTSPLFVNA